MPPLRLRKGVQPSERTPERRRTREADKETDDAEGGGSSGGRGRRGAWTSRNPSMDLEPPAEPSVTVPPAAPLVARTAAPEGEGLQCQGQAQGQAEGHGQGQSSGDQGEAQAQVGHKEALQELGQQLCTRMDAMERSLESSFERTLDAALSRSGSLSPPLRGQGQQQQQGQGQALGQQRPQSQPRNQLQLQTQTGESEGDLCAGQPEPDPSAGDRDSVCPFDAEIATDWMPKTPGGGLLRPNRKCKADTGPQCLSASINSLAPEMYRDLYEPQEETTTLHELLPSWCAASQTLNREGQASREADNSFRPIASVLSEKAASLCQLRETQIRLHLSEMHAKGLRTTAAFMIGSVEANCVVKNEHSLMQFLVMHPTSTPILLWVVIGPVMLLHDIVMIPLATFPIPNYPKDWSFSVSSLIVTIYWTFDTIRGFFTGYETENAVEMRPFQVARHYFRTWFLLDIATCSMDWVFLIIGDGEMFNKFWRTGRALQAWRILHPVRLVKVGMLMRTVHGIARPMLNQVLTFHMRVAMKSINVACVCVVICHYIACYWYAIGIRDGPTWLTEYFATYGRPSLPSLYTICFHWALAQSGFVRTNIFPTNEFERIFASGVGFLWLSVICVSINFFNIWLSQIRDLDIDREKQGANIAKYLQDHNVSNRLRYEVQRCFRVKYAAHRPRMHEEEIEFFRDLPLQLQIILHQEVYLPLLKSHPFFKFLGTISHSMLVMICHYAMHEAHVWSGQVVFSEGDAAHFMYNVITGHMEYYSLKPEVCCQKLSSGDWVCEPALWLHWVFRGRMVATCSGELAAVDTERFQAIIKDAKLHGKNIEAIRAFAIGVCEHFVGNNPETDFWAPEDLRDVSKEVLAEIPLLGMLATPPT